MVGFAQPNLMAHLQVLSVGAAEASPTCLVITDRDRCVLGPYRDRCPWIRWMDPILSPLNPHTPSTPSFMINVGEGTQRLGMEHKVRLTRLFDHIFLTGLTPACFGGLPGKAGDRRPLPGVVHSDTALNASYTTALLGLIAGMLLTLADCGKTAITVHGPAGTRQLLRSTTHFMRR